MTSLRRILAPMIVLAAFGIAPSVGGARVLRLDAAAAVGSATATLSSCTAASASSGGAASFTAQMQAIAGSQTMGVSFVLYERVAGGTGYVLSSAPGFGTWQDSKLRITDFTANENVIDLPAGAAFRSLVRYRWLGRHHRVLLRAAHYTPPCVIAALTPDLFIGPITRHAGASAGTVVYGVTVHNAGSLAAGAFNVSFSVGSDALAEQGLPGLAADSVAVVEFTGPRCSAGMTLTATADPERAVVEPGNNARSRSLVCSA